MNRFLVFAGLILFLSFNAAAQTLDRVVIFSDDFENPDAVNAWQVATNGGRIRIGEDPRNAANHGLIMDDATNDAVFKQNTIRKTVSIDGFAAIRVSVDVLSFNDEPQNGPDGLDGLTIRAGDLVARYQTDWSYEQHLEMFLDSRFEDAARRADGTITIELNQYDNFSMPDDGLFFDNVTVTGVKNRTILVEAPLSITESAPLKATVVISPIPTETVQLSFSDFSGARRNVIYPAGASSALLNLGDFNDNELEGDRYLWLSLTDGVFSSQYSYVRIIDDELSGLGVSAPSEIFEGQQTNGLVNISATHSSYLNIYLESSDPSVLTVPQYISVSPFQNPTQFPIQTTENRRITGDREVTITASFGAETVTTKIKVLERNSLTPVVSGPAQLIEGDQDIPFTFTINGISDQAQTVALSVEPSTVSIAPTTVTLQPGEWQGTFKVSVPDDTDAQGDRPFKIIAQINATTKNEFAGMLIDNEIVTFALDLPSRIQAETSTAITVRAVSQSGAVVQGFNGSADIYLKDKTTGVEEPLLQNVAFSQGRATVALNLRYSARGSRLVVRSATGLTATSPSLVLFAKLTFAANDLVWDSKRNLLYATSGGIALPGYLQSLTPITPDTAALGTPLFLGGDPRKAVITDDNKYLYIGQWSTYSVRRIDLDSFAVAANIVLNSDSVWANNSFQPYDILPVPGRPLDVIVSQNHTTSTYHTTRLYVNGVLQTSDSSDAIDLAPSGATNEFFGYNSYSSGYQLNRFTIGAKSYTVSATSNGYLFSGSGFDFKGEGDLLFSGYGRVVNGRKMETVTDLKFPNSWNSPYPWQSPRVAVTPNVARGRVYYARGNSLASYDTTVFQLIDETQFPLNGNITRIVRWGDTGLAFLTDNAELLIVDDDRLVPSGAPADLAVSLASSPQPVVVGADLTYTGSVENLGTNAARNVSFTFNFSPGQQIKSINGGNRPQTSDGTNVVIQIGDMDPGAKLQLSIVVTPTNLTTIVANAGATTASLDSDYANNKASLTLNVGFVSNTNSVNIVKLPINDVVYEPHSKQLVVAVTANAPAGAGNHIMMIDPLTGAVTKSIATPGEPWRLAVSDDGTTAYALSLARNTAFRVNLATGQLVRTITLNSGNDSVYATDIKVLHGTNDSFIVASGWTGIRVYDFGVLRGQGSGIYTGDFVVLTPDKDVAFGVGNSDTYKYQINGSGVQFTAKKSLFVGTYQLKSDGYYVYGNDGRAVRSDLMSIESTFSFDNAFQNSSYGYMIAEPDRANQRVYYSRGTEIASFDSQSYLRLRTVQFPFQSAIMTLVRWGADGFAARLDNSDLVIIRSDLVSQTASPIDLIVSTPEGLSVNSPTLTISGQAFHGQGIANVKVGDVFATTSNNYNNWFAQVRNLVPGENTITITATSLGAPAATRTVTRKINYVPSGAAIIDSQWVITHFGAVNAPQSGATDDPDGDGQSNLAEFIFGTDPHVADKPAMTLTQKIDGLVGLDFTHLNTDAVDFVIEASGDLSAWNTITAPRRDTVVPGESYMTSGYTLPTAGASMRFYRINVVPK